MPSQLTPKARRTREALIGAARIQIGIGGPDSLNVLQICERAGVGRTSFYNYFPDAEALRQCVAEEVGSEIKTQFDALHLGQERGLDRLAACLSMILHLAVEDKETVLLLTSLAQVGSALEAMLRAEISAELSGAVQAGAISNVAVIPGIAEYLSIGVLALGRELASDRVSPTAIPGHIDRLMAACG